MLYNGERHVCSLLSQIVEEDVLLSVDGLRYRVVRWRSLNWSHGSTLQSLQGVPTSQILGPAVCLLKGRHRDPFEFPPGMDGVELAFILDNPEGLSTEQIFHKIYKHKSP